VRGPKPKPVEQRRLEGRDVSKRPMPEPLLVAGRPEHELDKPPAGLPLEAKRYWRKTVARLVEVGMIDLVDEAALRMLSIQYARWLKAGEAIAEEGMFTVGSRGQPKEHPAVRVEREATVLYLRTAEQFGLTPMARTRLGLAELHRRSLHAEMDRALDAGPVVDGEVVDGDDDVGLPGAA
jgi:P27 family predicted phage terminase small subunit